jgi:PTH1 family peptidyl-tRNA hydrolase
MKLVVGLGNPGKKYAKTRHNAGFMAIDMLYASLASYRPSAWDKNKKFNAEISGCSIAGEKVILAKPLVFMNESGISVSLIAHYYKIPPRDILILHDDKDIALGEIRAQENRGAAGHHGVESVFERLGTEDIARIRIGVKPDNPKKMRDAGSFVLSRFGIFEKKKLERGMTEAVHAALAFLKAAV